jgi:hypothetical protein
MTRNNASRYSVIYKEANSIQNKLFIDWCKKHLDDGFCLRMHTLNYDRIFKVLLQDQNISVFEGFDLETSSTYPGQYVMPDLKKISTDFSSNVFYNLHGSAYWDFADENLNQLPGRVLWSILMFMFRGGLSKECNKTVHKMLYAILSNLYLRPSTPPGDTTPVNKHL